MRILIVTLIASFLLNAAGITFFVLFLCAESQVKSMKKKFQKQLTSLEVIRAEPNKENTSAILSKRMFISHFDGQPDSFAVSPPFILAPTKAVTLVVYLHGQGSTYLEPFEQGDGPCIAEPIVKRPNTVLLSCNYRAPASWGSDAAISDITQNIREMSQEYPIDKIVMMGTSMGGSIAPTYATLAPPDIKDKIVGVVSVEGTGDLSALFHETKMQSVKNALMVAFGGTPETNPNAYAAKSFLTHIHELPKGVKFVVVSASKDSVVPRPLQNRMVETLQSSQIPCRMIELDIHHEAPPVDVYDTALGFVLM
ncbi:MAG TPA: alpha/beta hydrolase fold domain-containing protein [Drouetiella sp.]